MCQKQSWLKLRQWLHSSFLFVPKESVTQERGEIYIIAQTFRIDRVWSKFPKLYLNSGDGAGSKF